MTPLIASLAVLPEAEQRRFVEAASADELAEIYYVWSEWARPSQLPPPGDWRVWLILAGYVVATWAGPIIVDHLWFLMADWNRSVGVVSAFSPTASIYVLWTGEGINVMPGVMFQAGLAVVMGVIFYGRRWAARNREVVAG